MHIRIPPEELCAATWLSQAVCGQEETFLHFHSVQGAGMLAYRLTSVEGFMHKREGSLSSLRRRLS